MSAQDAIDATRFDSLNRLRARAGLGALPLHRADALPSASPATNAGCMGTASSVGQETGEQTCRIDPGNEDRLPRQSPVSIAITRNGKLLDHFCAQYVRPVPACVRCGYPHNRCECSPNLNNTNHGRRS